MRAVGVSKIGTHALSMGMLGMRMIDTGPVHVGINTAFGSER